MQVTTENKLLRINEVATWLDVTEARAYELARTGLIPAVRIGRQLRVDATRLQAWIEAGGEALPGGWKRQAD